MCVNELPEATIITHFLIIVSQEDHILCHLYLYETNDYTNDPVL